MGFDNPNVVKATMLSGEILLKKSFKDSLLDRKSTRLNSSHSQISYAVFCLNKNRAQPHLRVHEVDRDRLARDRPCRHERDTPLAPARLEKPEDLSPQPAPHAAREEDVVANG